MGLRVSRPNAPPPWPSSCSPTPWARPAIAPASNVAQGKPATASSSLGGSDPWSSPGSAVDGKTGGFFARIPGGSPLYHSAAGDVKPWWKVDLKGTYKIENIKIFNRQDCCHTRLRDIDIDVLKDGKVVSHKVYQGRPPVIHKGTPFGPQELLVAEVPGGAVGDAVKITQHGANLQLAEVQVMARPYVAPPAPPPPPPPPKPYEGSGTDPDDPNDDLGTGGCLRDFAEWGGHEGDGALAEGAADADETGLPAAAEAHAHHLL
eukprot:tig00020961_g16652.t1